MLDYYLPMLSLFVPPLCLGAAVLVMVQNKTSSVIIETVALAFPLLAVWLPELLSVWSLWALGIRIATGVLVLAALLTAIAWCVAPLVRMEKAGYVVLILVTFGYVSFAFNLFWVTHSP